MLQLCLTKSSSSSAVVLGSTVTCFSSGAGGVLIVAHSSTMVCCALAGAAMATKAANAAAKANANFKMLPPSLAFPNRILSVALRHYQRKRFSRIGEHPQRSHQNYEPRILLRLDVAEKKAVFASGSYRDQLIGPFRIVCQHRAVTSVGICGPLLHCCNVDALDAADECLRGSPDVSNIILFQPQQHMF